MHIEACGMDRQTGQTEMGKRWMGCHDAEVNDRHDDEWYEA